MSRFHLKGLKPLGAVGLTILGAGATIWYQNKKPFTVPDKPRNNPSFGFERYGLHELQARMAEEKAQLHLFSDHQITIQCPTHICVGKLSGYFKWKGYQQLDEINGVNKMLYSSKKPNVFIAAPSVDLNESISK